MGDRRGITVWLILTVSLSMFGLSSPGSNPADAEEVVNVIHYGGQFGEALRKALFDPAEARLHIRIHDVSRTDMAKIKAMVQSGKVEWDIANVNTLEVWRGVKEGLWEPIDYSIVDRSVVGSSKEYEYGIPFVALSVGLVYSTKTYPSPDKAPQSWADFWDVKRFPGGRTLENRARYVLEFALMADGVPAGKLYPMDVDRAFKKLDQIKPSITTWSKPPAGPAQLIADGEVVMGNMPNNEWAEAARQGVPIGWQWNQALLTTNAWTVLKGTPHKQAVMQVLREITKPDLEAKLAELTYMGPINPKAIPLVSSKVLPYIPTTPDQLKKQAVFDHEWMGAHEAELIEKWTAWVPKK